MNPLDRFFKNKLQNREFEFQDAYWQQAEQMIIADQAGRRWKKGLWFLSALLILVVSVFIMWPENQEGSVSPVSQASEFGSSLPLKNANEEQQVFKKEETDKSTQNATAENSKSQNLNSNVSKGRNSDQTTAQLNSKVLEVGNPKNTDNLENLPAKNVQPFNSNKSLNQDLKSGLSIADENADIENQKLDPTKDLSAESASGDQKQSFLILESIESISEMLASPELEKLKAIKIQSQKEQRFSIGLSLATVLNSSQRKGKILAGYNAGLAAQYRFTNTFSINTEILYCHKKNLTLEVSTSFQNQYSFGLTSNDYKQYAESLHYLEVPLYLQWRNGRHAFEGGASVSFLTGVRGKTQRIQSQFPWENNGGAYKTEILGKSWFSEENFNRVNTSLLIGYRYFINADFSIGLRTSYRLNEITKYKADPAEIRVEPTELQFQLSAIWMFY